MFEENTFLMAARLKELRESKKLSHQRLSTELRARYGIKISKDVLIAYEAPMFHARAGANDGMGVRYLRCLADFYGVSSDYLLGLSDIASPNADDRAICESIGIKENSLRVWKRDINPADGAFSEFAYKPVDFINELLLSDYAVSIWQCICSSISRMKSVANSSIFDLDDSELDELVQVDEWLEARGRQSFSIAEFNYNQALSDSAAFYSFLNEFIRDEYKLVTERENKMLWEGIEAARRREEEEAAD